MLPVPVTPVTPIAPTVPASRPVVHLEQCGHITLGVIRNSLFGSIETWTWQVLSNGGKQDVSNKERGCEGGRFATVEMTDKSVHETV